MLTTDVLAVATPVAAAARRREESTQRRSSGRPAAQSLDAVLEVEAGVVLAVAGNEVLHAIDEAQVPAVVAVTPLGSAHPTAASNVDRSRQRSGGSPPPRRPRAQ